jgi:hypothetical protein
MGYSSRYHVASLAAVFLALAVGILIGSEVGGDLLNSTRQDLERSLTEDLDQSRAEVRSLRDRLDQADEFGAAILPGVVGGRLEGARIGLVGFGTLPGDVVGPVEESLRAAGATLAATGSVRNPPDRKALAASLKGTRFSRVDRRGKALSRYGRTVGRQLVTGGQVLSATTPELFTESSGRFGRLDGVVLYRDDETDPGGGSGRLDRAILAGIGQTKAELAAVDLTEADGSALSDFREANISTVDSVDLYSGRVALIYVLDGATGSFGVSDQADRLLPQPLIPPGRG